MEIESLITAFCICGNKLDKSLTKIHYKPPQYTYAECDKCSITLQTKDIIFHCSKKCKLHEEGYDLCMRCAKEESEKREAKNTIKLRFVPKLINYFEIDRLLRN